MKQKILMTLALLITAASGAWAQGAFSSDPYTSTTEFNSVSVTSSMTLNINEGVIVTVNSGLTIEDGVTLTLTGGGRLSVYGKSGNWGRDASYEEGTLINEATAGGDGNPAIILNGNAKIVIDNGEIYAEGGQGGFGGADATAGTNQPDGAAGNAFSRFPTIDGATLYYKSSNEWFKYTSGDQTLYNKMKAVPATIEVTTNKAEGETTFTEAWFNMPVSDATVSYELVRDMAQSVTATMNASIFRLMEDGQGGYKPVEGMPTPELTVKDELGTEAITMTEGTTAAPADYTAVLQKLTSEEGAQEEEWTDVSAEDGPTLGTYRYAITGQGDYDGTIYTENFLMSLRIPAEISYAQTFLNKDKGDVFVNTLTNTGDGEVTYTLAGDNIATIDPETGKVTITGRPGVVTVTATVEDSGDYSYETKSVTYVISVGLPLADPPYDYDDKSIGAHKLALLTVINIAKEIDLTNKTDKSANKLRMTIAECEELLTSKTVTHEELDEARIRLLIAIDNLEDKAPADADADIANGQNQETTTGAKAVEGQSAVENWYTLNGRKLDKKPTKKGVYILNGRKVVIK